MPRALTRRDAEPAGANCAHGGTAIRAGSDRNGNGVLDDSEVDHTSLDGLEAVTELPLALELQADPVLRSVAALRNVTRIGFLTSTRIPCSTSRCPASPRSPATC